MILLGPDRWQPCAGGKCRWQAGRWRGKPQIPDQEESFARPSFMIPIYMLSQHYLYHFFKENMLRCTAHPFFSQLQKLHNP